MQKERRLFVRFSMSGMVVVQPDPQKPGTVNAELVNLSFDGIGLSAPCQFPPGTEIKFVLINRQLNVNISGLGRVIYSIARRYNDQDSFRTGIEFIDVDRLQIRTILMRVREIADASGD